EGEVTVTWEGDEITAELCQNNYIITRTYKATSTCGGTATCSQTITVKDKQAPVISTAEGSLDVILECSNLDGITAALGQAPEATDNCTDEPAINLVSDNTTQDPACA